MEHFKKLPTNWIFTYNRDELSDLAKQCGLKVESGDTKQDIIANLFNFQFQESSKSALAGGGESNLGFSDLASALKGNSEQMLDFIKTTHSTLREERKFFQEQITGVLDAYNKQERTKKINIPYFKSEDDIENYLSRFETLAHSKNLTDTEMASQLFAHLTGKALDVCTKIPNEDKRSYKAMKKALLNRYGLTPDEYRKKFREAKLQLDETFKEFVQRLRTYIHRWQNT